MPYNPFVPSLNRYTTASPDHQTALPALHACARPQSSPLTTPAMAKPV